MSWHVSAFNFEKKAHLRKLNWFVIPKIIQKMGEKNYSLV